MNFFFLPDGGQCTDDRLGGDYGSAVYIGLYSWYKNDLKQRINIESFQRSRT